MSERPDRDKIPARGALRGFLALIWLLTACGDDGAVVGDGVNATTAVVDNTEGLWESGEEWTVSLEPVVEIGAVEGSPGELLQDVADAARQSDGDLLVADGGAGTVSLYAPDGSLKALLGRRGPAPGEFRRPAKVMVTAGDTVLVWDQAEWRLSAFHPDGDLEGVETVVLEPVLRATAPPLYPGTAMPLGSDVLLVRLVEKGKESPPLGLSRPRSGAVRITVEGEVLDTITLFPDTERYVLDSPWGPWPAEPPLARSTLVAIQPDGEKICVGDQAVAAVRCFRADGSVTEVRWTADPPEMDPQMVDAWRDRVLEEFGGKLDPADARRLVAQFPEPTTAPEFTALLLDNSRHLWVVRGATGAAGPGAYETMVFRDDGVLLGRLTVPRVRVLEVGPDYLLGVRRDDLGVQFVGVYRLHRGGA